MSSDSKPEKRIPSLLRAAYHYGDEIKMRNDNSFDS